MGAVLTEQSSELLTGVLKNVKRSFKQVAGFSFIINLLLLVSPIYMLQLYDRVLSSGSKDTLLVLTAIALFLLGLLALMETVRNRIMVRSAALMDRDLKTGIFERLIMRASLQKAGGAQGMRDLDTMRQFVSSNAPFAFFDAPWTPLFILIVAMMHPLLGLVALVGAFVILGLAVATEVVSRDLLKEAGGLTMQSNQFMEASLRNHEVLRAMNLADGLKKNWAEKRDPSVILQAHANERVGLLLGITKAVRFGLQVIMLGMGGWLAIDQQISPGAIVASSIIMGRALAPVEQAIGAWRQVVGARGAYTRLKVLIEEMPDVVPSMPLPRPSGDLIVNKLVAALPGVSDPILKGINFKIAAGEVLGIVGPSGAGKSFLARHLVGVRKAARGDVRLGGIDVAAWSDADRGLNVGYLPQDIELFSGTIADNIARFGEVDSTKVFEVAKMAGCHELILGLPNGYETIIGADGVFLSGGQSQRIALARAIYNKPVLTVLDEPNSNLDTEGEVALVSCIQKLKEAGLTTVLITHNIRLLKVADQIMVVKDGSVADMGSRDEVLKKFIRPSNQVTQGGGA